MLPNKTLTLCGSNRCLSHRPHLAIRRYATSTSPPADARTPPTWPKTAKPTPYEIFNQTPSEPYSKARFFELAKLYHPDRYAHHDDGPDADGLTRAVKLERYRLVVAANDLLADPALATN